MSVEIPEYLKESTLYHLYLLLEAMPAEPDDCEDLRMQSLYAAVDTALMLQITPEEVVKNMNQEERLRDLTETSLGPIIRKPVGDIL